MKYLIFLYYCLGIVWAGRAQNITLHDCEFRLFTVATPGNIPFYAIQEKEGIQNGIILFSAPSSGWIYTCYRDNHVIKGNYALDSSYVEVPVSGDGVYRISAEKPGESPLNSEEFRIFYVQEPDFEIAIPEEFRHNCAMTRIDITKFSPVWYAGTFPGDGTYTVSWRRNNENWHDIVHLSLESVNRMKIPDERVALLADRIQDAVYEVKVTDLWGFGWQREVEYASIFPKAEAEIKLWNEVNVSGAVHGDMGQAPLEVSFYNKSINAGSYEWLLYKDTADIVTLERDVLDSLIDGQIRIQPEFSYTYAHSGKYKVILIAENEVAGCRDTTRAYYVNVVESLVDVPNVFTPNGDGKNDVSMVQALSVENFHGVILNRWGRKVYEWSDSQGGWDGRINGKYATPGTYYYIITAKGRERNDPPEYVKKGALMLIR